MMRFIAWLGAGVIMPLVAGLALVMFVDLAATIHPAYSYHHMLFLLDALSGLFLVMTAVPAAALSLGAAFLLARARGAGRNGYLVAGAAAGLVHSVFAYWIIHLNALGHAPRYVTNGDIYYGFALMLGAATRFEAVVVTLAVMLAGAISGLVFSLCCRGFQKTRSSPQPI